MDVIIIHAEIKVNSFDKLDPWCIINVLITYKLCVYYIRNRCEMWFMLTYISYFVPINRIWWLYRSTLVEWYKKTSSTNWPREFGIRGTYKCARNPTYWGLKSNWGMESKNGLQNLWGNIVFLILCYGIRCHCSYKIFPYITLFIFLTTLCPTSLANLVVGVGTRHSHRILLHNKLCKLTKITQPHPSKWWRFGTFHVGIVRDPHTTQLTTLIPWVINFKWPFI